MKKKLFDLIEKEDKKNPLTDDELASALNISRQAVVRLRKKENLESYHVRRQPYLIKAIEEIIQENPLVSDREITNILQKKGYDVSKFLIASYKKEYFTAEKQKIQNEASATSNYTLIRESIIGFDGSIKNQIKKAEASVLYPPNGLHTLIVGETGTGKSLLADTMYQFALEKGKIQKDHFVRFNCADYFNNPQLLISILFGHVKGAFTGADTDKKGLIEKANGGILFLDEIHRLPPEGQEILFSIIDKGTYRRLGETEKENKISIMMIGATTEDIYHSLSATFIRRMPMLIKLPSLGERDIHERYQLIKMFFTNESHAINAGMKISSEVLCALLTYNCSGNIGQLKADIQVACARSYIRYLDKKDDMMKVNLYDFSINVQEGFLRRKYYDNGINLYLDQSIKVFPDKYVITYDDSEDDTVSGDIYEFIEQRYKELESENISSHMAQEILGEELEYKIRKSLHSFENTGRTINADEIIKAVGTNIFSIVQEMFSSVQEKVVLQNKDIVYSFALHFKQSYERICAGKTIENPKMKHIKSEHPIEFGYAQEMLKIAEDKLNIKFPEEEAGYLAIYLFSNKPIGISESKVQIIIASHGFVALEMTKLANRLLGQNFVRSICIDLDYPDINLIDETIKLAKNIDQGKGILLLCDMGTPSNFGDIITERTGIDTRTIPNVYSALALDIAFRILHQEISLDEIYNDIIISQSRKKNNLAEKRKAIITLCLTGKGAALEIKRYLIHSIPQIESNNIKVINLSMMQKDLIKEIEILENEYCIMLIVGTVNPKISHIPFIGVKSLFEDNGIVDIKRLLRFTDLTSTEQNKALKIKDLLNENYIFVDYNTESKELLLQDICGQLTEGGYVKKEFFQGVIQREETGETCFNGVAFPHTWPEMVNVPIIAVCILRSPLAWSEDFNVNIVFVLGLQVADNDIISRIYEVGVNMDLFNQLQEASSKAEVINLLSDVLFKSESILK